MLLTLMGNTTEVKDMQEASDKVRALEIGSSSFYTRGGANLYEGNTQIAYVSYNGRVWKGKQTSEITEEIKLTN